LLMDIAARLSRGAEMPDGSPPSIEVADAVFLTYEDDAADTLKPRLLAAGGDDARVQHVKGLVHAGDPDASMLPTLPDDLDALERAISARSHVRLVVIDPLSAALAGNGDMHTDI